MTGKQNTTRARATNRGQRLRAEPPPRQITMQIPLYGPHSLAPIGEVSRRKATSLLLNREATRLLDKHRVEIGIRMKPAAIVEV